VFAKRGSRSLQNKNGASDASSRRVASSSRIICFSSPKSGRRTTDIYHPAAGRDPRRHQEAKGVAANGASAMAKNKRGARKKTKRRTADKKRGVRKEDALLFFDEADALFGKRTEVKDAHDRYANKARKAKKRKQKT
jgi:hypothetical protein